MQPRFALLPCLLLASLLPRAAQAQTAPDSYLARAERVLATTPLVDGHNDLAWRIREDSVHPRDVEAYDLRRTTPGMTDLERLRKGRVGAQFWSVYIPGEATDPVYATGGRVASTAGYARVQLEQIELMRRVITRYPELAWALSADGVRRRFREHKIGSLLGLEGGHVIENSLALLRAYHELGARYMTLTHNVTLDWADAALDSARHGGLTPFGEEVVREMNRLGMLVDLSHVSDATMSDALRVSKAPIIFSHSGTRALVDHPRNVPDSILTKLRGNGGVIMLTFVPDFVSREVAAHSATADSVQAALRERSGSDTAMVRGEWEAWQAAYPAPRATLAQVADQIEHARRVAGVDHVGIGSDFDGISQVPVGLEDVSTFPALFAELARRGWTDAELRKLAGENVLRVLGEAEGVARRLQRERPPSNHTIGELDTPAPSAPR